MPLVPGILNASIFLTAFSVFIKRKRIFRGELEWKLAHNSEESEGCGMQAADGGLGVLLFHSRNPQFNRHAASSGTSDVTLPSGGEEREG